LVQNPSIVINTVAAIVFLWAVGGFISGLRRPVYA
jgi:hypothetical protein